MKPAGVMCFASVLLMVAFADKHGGLETGSGFEKDRARRVLLEDNYENIVIRLNSLASEVTSLKSTIASLTHGTVAFKAHLRKAFSPQPNQLIEFDDIQFNLGNAYNAGTFIAPYNGTYLFSVNMCSAPPHYIMVDLMRNGATIGQVLAGDGSYGDCSSETTITELNVGDIVNVHHHGNSGDYIHGNNEYLNSFTGVFLNMRI